MINIYTFFDKNYQAPAFINKKRQQERRQFLKSAAGTTAVAVLPFSVLSSSVLSSSSLDQLVQTDPWLTLNATLNHLLPASASTRKNTGPSAKEIQALNYLHQVMTVQPTAQNEKDFIIKGVSWLNGYAQSQKQKAFVELTFEDKEILLRGISRSQAGENWLSTLVGYIFEAMLSPSSYGGNPQGIGWQWLEHQAGFPLPNVGQRFFELPQRSKISVMNISSKSDANKPKLARVKEKIKGTRKA